METLNDSNFKRWKQDLELCLGYNNYEHVLHEDPPAELTPTSTRAAKDKYAQWHKHNRMALVIMKRSMSEAVKGGIPDAKLAREYFKNIEEKYQVSDKVETGALMNALTGMKFDGVGSIREYILKGTKTAAKLKAVGVTIDGPFLVHLILNSLPAQHSQLECRYNTKKEKWSVNELISMCVQEEDRIKKRKGVAINLVCKLQFKKKAFKSKYSTPSTTKTQNEATQGSNNFKNQKSSSVKCFFCRKPGHVKNDCRGFKDWMSKKGFSKKEDSKH